MSQLTGKTALITGGSSGIGLAIAKLFASEGAQIFISGRNPRALSAAVREIGHGAIGFEGDVADVSHHRRMADEIAAQFGALDIYVANAGINTIRLSSEVPEAEYDDQFAVNARGTFFGVQKMVPIMRDGGAVVVVGSAASDKLLEGHAVYAGTKAAIGAFARHWAVEFKERRIRVNTLSPGPTDTAILAKLGIEPEMRSAFEARMAAAIPLGRMGSADELARAALFLAADASSFVTGINLRVDGGMALL